MSSVTGPMLPLERSHLRVVVERPSKPPSLSMGIGSMLVAPSKTPRRGRGNALGGGRTVNRRGGKEWGTHAS